MNFEDELPETISQTPPEREISLGTGTILLIFFVLALVCGGFFGFGYSMGHRAAQTASSVPESSATRKDSSSSPFSNFKAAPVAETPSAETTPPKTEESTSAPDAEASTEAPGSTVQPPVASDGGWMVQVSATTRKPDAEALTKVLGGKGFTATIKQDADEKFHVRVGPFASKKDADTTRKLLVASGYKDPFLTPR